MSRLPTTNRRLTVSRHYPESRAVRPAGLHAIPAPMPFLCLQGGWWWSWPSLRPPSRGVQRGHACRASRNRNLSA